jgi:hypothetical protein
METQAGEKLANKLSELKRFLGALASPAPRFNEDGNFPGSNRLRIGPLSTLALIDEIPGWHEMTGHQHRSVHADKSYAAASVGVVSVLRG